MAPLIVGYHGKAVPHQGIRKLRKFFGAFRKPVQHQHRALGRVRVIAQAVQGLSTLPFHGLGLFPLFQERQHGFSHGGGVVFRKNQPVRIETLIHFDHSRIIS